MTTKTTKMTTRKRPKITKKMKLLTTGWKRENYNHNVPAALENLIAAFASSQTVNLSSWSCSTQKQRLNTFQDIKLNVWYDIGAQDSCQMTRCKDRSSIILDDENDSFIFFNDNAETIRDPCYWFSIKIDVDAVQMKLTSKYNAPSYMYSYNDRFGARWFHDYRLKDLKIPDSSDLPPDEFRMDPNQVVEVTVDEDLFPAVRFARVPGVNQTIGKNPLNHPRHEDDPFFEEYPFGAPAFVLVPRKKEELENGVSYDQHLKMMEEPIELVPDNRTWGDVSYPIPVPVPDPEEEEDYEEDIDLIPDIEEEDEDIDLAPKITTGARIDNGKEEDDEDIDLIQMNPEIKKSQPPSRKRRMPFADDQVHYQQRRKKRRRTNNRNQRDPNHNRKRPREWEIEEPPRQKRRYSI